MDPSADQIKNRDDKNKEVQNPEKVDQLCSKCGQYFTSLVDLAHHFFDAHRDQVQDFDCPMCPKIITSKYQGQKGSVELRKLVMHHIKYTHSKETKVRILCLKFSLNPLRFSLMRETDTKMTRAKIRAKLQF